MWAVIDLETTIYSGLRRKANPFLKDAEGNWLNWAVMMGYATKGEPHPAGFRMSKDTQHLMTDRFINCMSESRILVGQNIKFDIHYMIRDPKAYVAYQAWVAGGGIVWDLQLAEYMMQGQVRNSHMLSLDDLAMIYDEDLKVDEVKKLWQAGINTEDIDPDLLTRYLVGEDLIDPITGTVTGRKEGDIGVTRNIFLKQIVKAQRLGMMKTIQLNMGALLATIEMEFNGMFVNKDKGLQLAASLEEELAAAKEALNEYIPKDLPFEFNWGNRYHLSPVLFGGQIKYQRRQYDLKDGSHSWYAPGEVVPGGGSWLAEDYAYAKKTIKVDTGEVYKSGKNKGEPKFRNESVDDYTKPKSRMVDDFYTFDGYTEPRDEWKSETPGLWSVASDVIEALTTETDIPFLKTLGSVAKISKDLGTYFITTDDKGEQKGMLTLVGDDGIVHHSLNHTSTVTGRLSASAPNLQNIPKGNKSKAKEMFESRWGDLGLILQSDFSSLEVYVQANLTKAENLIIELLKGTDLHCLRLSKKEHMDYDEVVKLAKGYKVVSMTTGEVIHHAAVEEWDYKRTGAKVFSFQLAYGAGAKTISDATGLPLEEVEMLIAAENELFPEIAEYFDRRGEEIARQAKPTNQFVMHPANPAVRVQLMISRIQMETGKLYTYMSSPSPAFLLKRGITSTFSPTERKNYEVQGEGGEIMKCAMWLAVREFYRLNNFGGLAVLVNTVHDALYADMNKSVSDKALALIHACMESATDFYCHHFGIKWDVPVPSDTSYGNTMAEETKAKLDPDLLAAYTLGINERYLQGFTKPYQTL